MCRGYGQNLFLGRGSHIFFLLGGGFLKYLKWESTVCIVTYSSGYPLEFENVKKSCLLDNYFEKLPNLKERSKGQSDEVTQLRKSQSAVLINRLLSKA